MMEGFIRTFSVDEKNMGLFLGNSCYKTQTGETVDVVRVA